MKCNYCSRGLHSLDFSQATMISDEPQCQSQKLSRSQLTKNWIHIVMLFSFARVSAVLGMKVRVFTKMGAGAGSEGGKHHEVPVHHKAQEYVAEYLEKAGFEPNKPLFQTFHKKAPTGRPMSRSEAYRMIRRRALAAGIFAPVCCHSFRAPEITVYLENKRSTIQINL
jgi:integrase